MKPIFRSIQSQDDAPLAAIIRKSLTDHQLAVPGTAYFDPELDHLSEFYAADPASRHYFVVTDESGTLLGGGGLAAYDSEGQIAELQKFYLSDAAKGQRLSYPLLAKIEAKAF
ncbi:GNAT family N-acetyltransferase, partial [Listeria monocytogenes]|nr:GNAT family N-acetyltransferase [Listeria monocytogenes]